MSTLKKSAKSVVAIAVFSTGSKVLGFLREALIASKYGMGADTDSFFIALSAIGLFSMILMDTINTTLIPVLSDVEADEGKVGKVNHLNNFLNIISIAALILAVFAYFFTPLLMQVLGKGFEGAQFDQAVSLTRIGLPALIASSLIGIFRGYLQSEEQFYQTAATGFPKNFTYIIFLLLLAQKFSITALMVAHVVSEFAQFLVIYPGLRKTNYKYKWHIDIKDEYMQRIAELIPPILISVAINDLNNMIDKSMASSLVSGSVSALNYSSKLNSLVSGIFITALITVLFPMFSKEASQKNYVQLKKLVGTSINVVLLIVVPAAIGMIVLATTVTRLAYERGSFDSAATAMTASALIFYSMGLVGNAIKMMLNRVFYALQDTKTPMINGVYNLGLNFVFNLFFVQFMGHNGLALATSITTTLTAFVLIYKLRKKIGNLGFRAILQSAMKIFISAGVMGVAVYFIDLGIVSLIGTSTLMELIALMITVAIGVVIYLVLLLLFQVEELHFALDHIKGFIAKRKNK